MRTWPPLALALAANAMNCWWSSELYSAPFGSDIRPMWLSMKVVFVGVFSLVPFLLSLGIVWRRPRQFWPWLALVLSLTPLPLAIVVMNHATALRSLHWMG